MHHVEERFLVAAIEVGHIGTLEGRAHQGDRLSRTLSHGIFFFVLLQAARQGLLKAPVVTWNGGVCVCV